MAAKVAHPESIVETSWVEEHLNDDNLAIVEVEVVGVQPEKFALTEAENCCATNSVPPGFLVTQSKTSNYAAKKSKRASHSS